MNYRNAKAALAAAIFGLTATAASAAQFHLKLPMQAQWGTTLLEPGQYTLSTDSNSPSVMHITGNGRNFGVLVSATTQAPDGSPNQVSLKDIAGTRVIHELTLAYTGKTYRFAMPSAAHVARTTMAFSVKDQQKQR